MYRSKHIAVPRISMQPFVLLRKSIVCWRSAMPLESSTVIAAPSMSLVPRSSETIPGSKSSTESTVSVSLGDIHNAAVKACTTVMGDPHHYIMTGQQLRALVEALREQEPLRILPPPPC
jgi:hypothetical protein